MGLSLVFAVVIVPEITHLPKFGVKGAICCDTHLSW